MSFGSFYQGKRGINAFCWCKNKITKLIFKDNNEYSPLTYLTIQGVLSPAQEQEKAKKAEWAGLGFMIRTHLGEAGRLH